MRELLGSDKFDDKQRAKLFKKMFGYYDKGVFQMMTNKFKKLFEVNESLPNKVTDKFKKLKPGDIKDKKKFKAFLKHHQYHSGPHIDGLSAEDDTYDFDDENDDNEGGLQKDKDTSKRGYEPVREDDMLIFPWDNTKPKPKNPKLFDKKKRDLLHDIDFKKALKKLKIPTKILTNKNQLVKYLTSNPQIMSQLLRLVTEVDLPIKVGDTVRMGKFKNKKVVVKKIEWNEKGDLLINGRPALKFRLEKKAEVDEDYIKEIYMGYPDKKGLKTFS